MTDSNSSLAPPGFAIRAAVEAGARSPCAKSKRGAVVFKVSTRGTALIAGSGYNAQPAPFACTEDARCREACAKLCEHAEQRAIRAAVAMFGERTLAGYGLELVHAKVIDGVLVAGGGPSCWQCSREIRAVGIDAVWLYRLPTVAEANAVGVTSMYDSRFPGLTRWHRYTAEAFHRATLMACGIGADP